MSDTVSSSMRMNAKLMMERSITAEAAAWLRAVGARESDDTRRNPDHLAEDLLDPRVRAAGRIPGAWALALRAWEAFAPGYYEYELARTRYIDGVLHGELEAGIDQLVLVGSGYDSRVYRFAEQLADVRTFEIDREVTLELKRRRAVKRGYRADQAVQVALDLNLATPLEALRRHGYDDDARTLFVCSGVLMYVDPDAVDRLFGFVAEAGDGSSICFDYAVAAAMENPADHYGARQMLRNVRRAGEPYKFAVDPPVLPALLDRQGLHLISSAPPEDLKRDYLTGPDGAERGPICGYLALAHAGRCATADPLG